MIQLRDVTLSFPGCSAPVLNGINLTVLQGEFCVVLGSNGCGKTTLLKAVSGECKIDAGSISIDGQDLTHKDRSSLIASVVQDVNQCTVPDMTVLENMILGMKRGRAPRLRWYQREASAVKRRLQALGAGLDAFVHQPLKGLSGGQKQMIALLMAVMSCPKVLLLDEHTAALSTFMQAKVMHHTVEAIQAQKMTCLMVTHRLDDVIRYGDRVIFLHQGRIVQDLSGASKSALRMPALLEMFHHYEDLALTQGMSL